MLLKTVIPIKRSVLSKDQHDIFAFWLPEKDQVIKAKFRETLEKDMLGVRSIISGTIFKKFDLLSYQNLKWNYA